MKLTDRDKIDIVDRYNSGESSVQIAKYYNITRQSVLQILKVRDVKIRTDRKK